MKLFMILVSPIAYVVQGCVFFCGRHYRTSFDNEKKNVCEK